MTIGRKVKGHCIHVIIYTNRIHLTLFLQVLIVECPLAELLGYSTAIRTLSSGTASFTMELSHYRLVDASQQAAIVEAVTGFQPL